MGGGTSKFEETNWVKADGGLESAKDTVDGAAPSEGYRRIHVVKRGFNQREFDVIDVASRRLLYTTRAVPGTLAWFDVLGPKSCGKFRDLVLRVQVDLSRRTWTVYRYHLPVFEGQKPATLTVHKGLQDHRVQLFKAACVTVAWSRYVAIVARYGPPSEEHLRQLQLATTTKTTIKQDDLAKPMPLEHKASEELSADSPESIATTPSIETSLNASTTDAKIVSSSSSSPSKTKILLSRVSSSCSCSPQNKSPDSSFHNPSRFDTPTRSTLVADPKGSNSLKKYFSDRLMQSPFGTEAVEAGGTDPSTDDQESIAAPTEVVAPSVDCAGLPSPKKLACASPPDKKDGRDDYEAKKDLAMEGMIDLHGPLIECQEIYNKIIGNHQTALIGKEKVLHLFHLDEAQHHPVPESEMSSSQTSPLQASPATPLALSPFSRETPRHQQETDDDAHNPFVQAVHEEEERSQTFSPRHVRSSSKRTTPFSSHSKSSLSVTQESQPPEAAPSSTNPSNWFSRLQASMMFPQESSTMNAQEKGTNATPSKQENDPSAENAPTTAVEITSLTKSKPWLRLAKNKDTTTEIQEISFEEEKKDESLPVLREMDDQDAQVQPPKYQEDLKPTSSNTTSTTIISSSTPSSASSSVSLLDMAVAQEGLLSATGRAGKVLFPPLSPVHPLSPQEKNDLPNLMDDDDDDNHGEDSDDNEGSSSSEDSEEDSVVVVPDQEGSPAVGIQVVEPEEDLGSPEAESEPLIGYWSWKNTYTVHKVELHLAQNSDMALHVVLAILCNQIRCERNALAMTI